ncbi:MAG: class I SAM-dependent methyltransferase [Promethearchaeota archaeon]
MNEDDIEFKGSVQETMLGPLWARATFSRKYPELLNDQKSIEIIQNLDYDFSKIAEYLEEWRGLALLARANSFDKAVRKYIEKKPNATIVNIGAGLDTTYYRIDNGKIKWYDLDLPDAIDFRRKFLSETSRNKFISKSAFDLNWFEDIEFTQEDGIFFIAGGFIYYYQEIEISSLIDAMAQHFIEGELIFDCISKMAMKIGNRRLKKIGVDGPFWQFSISDPDEQIPKWSEKIQIIDCFGIWTRTPLNPAWDKSTLKMIKITRRLKTGKIVQIKFTK